MSPIMRSSAFGGVTLFLQMVTTKMMKAKMMRLKMVTNMMETSNSLQAADHSWKVKRLRDF